jgi:DNA polymerase III subunit delta
VNRKPKSAAFTVDPSMPIIVLHGKDAYMMTARTREIADMLREAHGEIEQFEFDGDTAELADVLDELRSYGLIQRHKLVILNKADAFLAPKSPTDDSRYRRAMEAYAQNPVDSATLLMRADTWRAGNLDKHIAKAGGAVFKIEQPTAATALKWMAGRVQKRYDAAIESAAAQRLVEQIGPDLARLDVELAKLAAFVGSGQTITRQHVNELVGMSREEEVWAIQAAVASGSPDRAVAKLREVLSVKDKEVVATWAICDLLRKMHAAAHLLREGVNTKAISGQLKLWGDSQQAILAAARRCEPARLAELLQAAIQTDLNSKSGTGEIVRSLEALTVRVADGIGVHQR